MTGESGLERWDDPGTVAGAQVLDRLRDSRIGADRRNPGKYALYFYDDEENEIRSVGGFESPRAADRALNLILAESVVEEALCADAEVER